MSEIKICDFCGKRVSISKAETLSGTIPMKAFDRDRDYFRETPTLDVCGDCAHVLIAQIMGTRQRGGKP